jgi:hypothetical protein
MISDIFDRHRTSAECYLWQFPIEFLPISKIGRRLREPPCESYREKGKKSNKKYSLKNIPTNSYSPPNKKKEFVDNVSYLRKE